MVFEREKIGSYYLHDTAVDNIFINEFVPGAPGDYVKVYLFALMYADIRESLSNEDVAKQLSLQVEDVLSAWTYWEGKGVVRKRFLEAGDKLRYTVEFVDLKEQVYGIGDKTKRKKNQIPDNLKNIMDDGELRKIYTGIEQITGRLIQGKEPVTILNWIEDYGVTPDFILYTYEYSSRERKNTNIGYVGKIIKEWSEKGLKTVEDIEEYLMQNDSRRYLYKRVMKALGFMRNPTEEERRIMDVWFDDLGLTIETVLNACKKTSGISNPNINYVNAVLTPKDKTAGGPMGGRGKENVNEVGIPAVIKSYEDDRQENEADAQRRREEVYRLVPRIKEIEDEIRNISMEISKTMLGSGSAARTGVKNLRAEYESLNNEKSYLLTDNNFKIDYMDMKYTCPICKDTGILDSGARCACFAIKLESLGK